MTTTSIRDVLASLCAGNKGGRLPDFPIHHDGCLVACNGRLQIHARWPDGGPKNTEWAKRFADLMRRFGGGVTEPWKIPNLGELTKPCKRCKGTGNVFECDVCDGEGFRECDLGEEHDCSYCRGSGTVPLGSPEEKRPCKECHGSGSVATEDVSVAFGNVILGKTNLGVLTKLTRLRFAIMAERKAEDPVYFTFDGGDGLVMPMRHRGIDAELMAVRALEDGR